MSTAADLSNVQHRGKPLRSRLAGAAVWSSAGYAASQACRLGSSLLLTRILFPEAFGLMAIVWAYVAGLAMFSDVGLWSYLLQSEKIRDQRFHDSIWSINIGRSILVLFAGVILAYPMAGLYGRPELFGMLSVAVLGQLIANLGSTKLIAARRDLKQKEMAVFDLLKQLAEIVATLCLAWWLRSPWAIVWGAVAGSVSYAVGSQFLFPGPRNHWRWDSAVVRELRGFSTWIYFSSIMTFLGGQADRLILGKLMPMDFLGLYGIAMTFTVLPLVLTQQVTKLISPVVVHLRHGADPKIQEKVQELRSVLLGVGAVLVAGMCVAAPAFFGLLYDARYAQAGTLAAIMAVSVWFQILETSASCIPLAFGDAKSTAMCSAAKMIGMLGGAFSGYGLAGVYGFVVGMSGGALAVYIVSTIRLRQHNIHLRWHDLRYCWAALGLACAGWATALALLTLGAVPSAVASLTGATLVAILGGLYLRKLIASFVAAAFERLRRQPSEAVAA